MRRRSERRRAKDERNRPHQRERGSPGDLPLRAVVREDGDANNRDRKAAERDTLDGQARFGDEQDEQHVRDQQQWRGGKRRNRTNIPKQRIHAFRSYQRASSPGILQTGSVRP